MKLSEKAEQGNSAEVRLAQKSVGQYEVTHDLKQDLVPADEISGEDEFPKFGDFLEVSVIGGGPEHELVDECYLEVPGNLAGQLMDMAIETGDCFSIDSCHKNAAGEWEYRVSEMPDS